MANCRLGMMGRHLYWVPGLGNFSLNLCLQLTPCHERNSEFLSVHCWQLDQTHDLSIEGDHIPRIAVRKWVCLHR